MPVGVRNDLGPLPEGYIMYFTSLFPELFLHVYYVIHDSSLDQEHRFRSYF